MHELSTTDVCDGSEFVNKKGENDNFGNMTPYGAGVVLLEDHRFRREMNEPPVRVLPSAKPFVIERGRAGVVHQFKHGRMQRVLLRVKAALMPELGPPRTFLDCHRFAVPLPTPQPSLVHHPTKVLYSHLRRRVGSQPARR